MYIRIFNCKWNHIQKLLLVVTILWSCSTECEK